MMGAMIRAEMMMRFVFRDDILPEQVGLGVS